LDFIKRKKSFVELGNQLKNLDPDEYLKIATEANLKNPWFTPESIQYSFDGLISYLDNGKFSKWLDNYTFINGPSKHIGVVMAGNIPMAGIHDFICVLISSHKFVGKLSSSDDVLIPFVARKLLEIEPEFEDQITFVDQLKNIDAAITTGSDNSARYFEHYFGKYPNIIRKNRTSIAVITGDESPTDLQNLSHDIYSYFGLGCRNVSKVFVPENYPISGVIDNFNSYEHLVNHTKYHNNYFYNKSIMLVNQTQHLDNGFSLFREDEGLVSPISVVFYEYYKDIENLKNIIDNIEDKIQCIVTGSDSFENSVMFGEAQKPEIWDFADNVDTLDFLLSL